MAISVDASRAFLLPSQLRRLAEAVRDAGQHDESSWIEWKSTLPLGTDQARVHLVKHILGLANRSPEVAARWAEGHGYLLVGVSPGEVKGVTSIDHSVMEQNLKPYIGPDLVWTPEYVELDGRDVLIVVVAPPRQGDPIRYLRKPLPHPKHDGFVHSEHTVFVRRNAQTVKAEPEEWQMLQLRFAATQNRLDAEVVAAQQRIERRADFPEHIKVDLGRYREWLLRGRYHGSGSLHTDPGWEKHVAEVDAYLGALEQGLRRRLLDELARHLPATLCLDLVNRVDRPFPGVKVILTLCADGRLECPGPVSEQLPFFHPQHAPRRYGTSLDIASEEAFLNAVDEDRIRHQADDPPPGGFRSEEVRQGDGLRITFDPVDLRPGETLRLPRVPLVVTANVDSVVTVEWNAAGLGADGHESGRIILPVAVSTLTPMKGDDLGMAIARALDLPTATP
ncbi:RNA-binding domain-containing protein [Actinomadura sp. KC216]|uniref:RNA-binding domain-containing protein n=1 Tax=Actinomadura sp. KC216 TaxID=2530370 RepID=UPI001404E4F4|nr:RNA-binding domain-containing protein [Actinomadura sp. KC216]